METILSTGMRRRFYVLHMLHNSNGWVTIEQLMKQMEASRKTIMRDLDYLAERWPDRITIDYQEKFGVRLWQSTHYSIHDIYRTMLKESSAFKLLEAVFFDPTENRDYWGSKFYLSQSSLYRLTHRLEADLSARGMRLNRTPYAVEGNNERQIQIFFKRFFWEIYGIHDWPFAFDQEAVNEFVEKLNHDFHWNHEDVDRVDLAFAIGVSLVRSEQGHLLLTDPNLTDKHRELINSMEKYRGDIERIIRPLGYKMPKGWKEDFILTIFWWEFAWDNPEEERRLHKLGYEFIDTIVEALGLSIDPESRQKIQDSFIKSYMRHKVYPYPRYIFYDRNWFASNVLQSYAPLFKEVLEKVLKDLEKKTKMPWYSMYFDHMLVMISSCWKDFSLQIDSLRKPAKVAVFSDLGMYHAESLGNYLKSVYQEKVEIIIQPASIYYLKDYPRPEADLYVANFSMEDVPFDDLFIVEDIPSYKNLSELQRKIDKLRVPSLRDFPFLG
ncbi:helix-turn-helix domain-containing protein [Enterococcus sp. LJL120]